MLSSKSRADCDNFCRMPERQYVRSGARLFCKFRPLLTLRDAARAGPRSCETKGWTLTGPVGPAPAGRGSVVPSRPRQRISNRKVYRAVH